MTDRPARVLVACEYSGRVREALRKRGLDAWSCDTDPADDASPFHYEGDVRDILNNGWDALIAFPPCTFLTVAGNAWAKVPERAAKVDEAVAFVELLWDAPIPRIAIENPVGVLSSRFRPPSQIICPSQFGHDEKKRTCLWLRRFPKLVPTKEMPNAKSKVEQVSRTRNRGKVRSLTYQGIADAMADQWGNLPITQKVNAPNWANAS